MTRIGARSTLWFAPENTTLPTSIKINSNFMAFLYICKTSKCSRIFINHTMVDFLSIQIWNSCKSFIVKQMLAAYLKVKAINYFRKKSSITAVWQDPKYASSCILLGKVHLTLILSWPWRIEDLFIRSFNILELKISNNIWTKLLVNTIALFEFSENVFSQIAISLNCFSWIAEMNFFSNCNCKSLKQIILTDTNHSVFKLTASFISYHCSPSIPPNIIKKTLVFWGIQGV